MEMTWENSRAPTIVGLLDRIERIEDDAHYEELVDRLTNGWIQSGETKVLAFVNAHATNLIWRAPLVANDFFAADTLLRDGHGMKILDRCVGRSPGRNMNGTDLIPVLIDRYRGKKLAVFGTAEPWLSRACDTLAEDGHTIVTAINGFKPLEDYFAALARHAPEVVILAMGMPKQEKLARAIKSSGDKAPTVIICGGAIIDFLAHRVSRAPQWMRQLGLEWLYRLFLEPRRLFRRYVVGNALFLFRIPLVVAAGKSKTGNEK